MSASGLLIPDGRADAICESTMARGACPRAGGRREGSGGTRLWGFPGPPGSLAISASGRPSAICAAGFRALSTVMGTAGPLLSLGRQEWVWGRLEPGRGFRGRGGSDDPSVRFRIGLPCCCSLSRDLGSDLRHLPLLRVLCREHGSGAARARLCRQQGRPGRKRSAQRPAYAGTALR
jgi:hypothetical protein